MMRDHFCQLSLLVVEDSPADVFLVGEAMRQEGLSFHLEVADNGERAIQILDQVDAESGATPPNLVLLDVNVPRRDGTQVLARLRQSPRCGNIPVVMISSSDSPADRQRAIDLGATEYFRKPSNLADFIQLGSLVRRLHEAGQRTTA
jgi:two-component system, chemotaxis family, response regulator Rcp1